MSFEYTRLTERVSNTTERNFDSACYSSSLKLLDKTKKLNKNLNTKLIISNQFDWQFFPSSRILTLARHYPNLHLIVNTIIFLKISHGYGFDRYV